MEIVAAGGSNDRLFRNHLTLHFRVVQVLIIEDAHVAHSASIVLVLVSGTQFEVVVEVVGPQRSWDEEPRPQFVLQNQK